MYEIPSWAETVNFSTSATLSNFVVHSTSYPMGKGKGKTIKLQAWTGPEDSRRLRLPDFKTIGT
jgi:hypothetical protein